MKKLTFIAFLLFTFHNGYGQQIMTVIPDSAALYGDDFVEVRFFAADFSAKTLNQDLKFSYVSQNTGYVLSHDMNVIGLNNIPNIGLGVEEDMGKHLLINFFNITGGYIQNTWELTITAGLGFSEPLNKKKTFRIRGTFNLVYEYLAYGLGTYSDTTQEGFVINGANIGTYVNNVKYVNSAFGISPGLDLFYRGNNFDMFLSAAYDYTFFYHEKINFYRTSIPTSYAIYEPNGTPVGNGAIVPGNYIIELGIIKEFGL